MNVLTRLALLPASLFLLLDACTLQDHEPSLQNPDCQVRTLVITNKSSFGPRVNKDEAFDVDGKQVMIGKLNAHTYTFDDQGRLTESLLVTYTGSTANVRSTYEYGTNAVTQRVYTFGDPTPSSETILPLNAQGLLSDPGLIYNAEGYLVEDNRSPNPTKYTVDSNGNIILIENFLSPGGPLNYSQALEYDLSKPNTPNPEPFRGKVSKNLPVKSTYTTYGINNVVKTSNIVDLKYLFDYAGHTVRGYNSGKVEGDDTTIYYGVTDYDITCR